MRLTGLPSTDRYPEAIVSRSAESVVILFCGKGEEQQMNIPLKYIGGDPESVELRLLADLKRMGYKVRRETV